MPFDTDFYDGFVALLTEHGETVTYRPANSLHREITALVQRQDVQAVDAVDGLAAPLLMVEALSDPDDEDYGGIDPANVDPGGDKIQFAARKGTAAKLWAIEEVLPTDGGVTRVRLR
jgi:hypothetical protein